MHVYISKSFPLLLLLLLYMGEKMTCRLVQPINLLYLSFKVVFSPLTHHEMDVFMGSQVKLLSFPSVILLSPKSFRSSDWWIG